jgi:hypothetical protein
MDYVDRIQGTMGRSAGAPAPFRLYRSVEIVEGHEVVKYSNVASPGAEVVSTGSRR